MTTGWSMLIKGAVCAAGALTFLRIVSNELAGAEEYLWRMEAARKDAAARRDEQQARAEAMIVAERVDGITAADLEEGAA